LKHYERMSTAEASESLPYSTVKVLMIRWKDSTQEDFKTQLKRLAREFTAHNYDVEEYEIESEKPQQSLSTRLLSFLSYDGRNTMLILYYGGHALNNQDKSCIWLR
jgi:hypothetical protein